jgi:hypothetical protein
MFNRNRISALFCLFFLPALAAAAAFPGKALPSKRSAFSTSAASPASPALTKADVNGFWSFEASAGLDVHVKVEIFFGTDGSSEGRGLLEDNGLTQATDQFGTWTIRKDTIVVKPDMNRCISKGDSIVAADCKDTSSSFYTIATQGGIKMLFDVTDGDSTEVGEFAGAQKDFTLPDMLVSAIFPGWGGAKDAARRSPVSVSGIGLWDRNGQVGGFDIAGRTWRASGQRGTAGMRGPAPERR